MERDTDLGTDPERCNNSIPGVNVRIHSLRFILPGVFCLEVYFFFSKETRKYSEKNPSLKNLNFLCFALLCGVSFLVSLLLPLTLATPTKVFSAWVFLASCCTQNKMRDLFGANRWVARESFFVQSTRLLSKSFLIFKRTITRANSEICGTTQVSIFSCS